MSEPSAEPLAVLFHLKGTTEVVTLSQLPPPRHIYKPERMPLMLVMGDPSLPAPTRRRVFELTRFNAPYLRWWRVYNDGRNRTHEAAFVYMERDLQHS